MGFRAAWNEVVEGSGEIRRGLEGRGRAGLAEVQRLCEPQGGRLCHATRQDAELVFLPWCSTLQLPSRVVPLTPVRYIVASLSTLDPNSRQIHTTSPRSNSQHVARRP